MMDKEYTARYVDLGDSHYKKAMFTTDQFMNYPMPKANEIIYLDDYNIRKRLSDLLPRICPDDTNAEGVLIRGDIFVAGTIPSPNIEMHWGSSKIRTLILDKEIIINDIKEAKDEKTLILIGKIEITTSTDKGSQKLEIPLRMHPNLIFEWFPVIRVSNTIFNASDEVLKVLAINTCKVRDMVFASYYGIQLALLNPVIAERFHRETVPYEDKTSINKRGNKKKPPKRYVKRITIDDLSDIEFSREKKAHHIKEPFWWVSGHWREYKSGKKIFIKGYWKGILRDAAEDIQSTPREREIVFEENDGKPYYK